MKIFSIFRLVTAFYLAAVYAFGSELRCHCNLQSCAKSNSMCKTVLGCFQELPSISQRELRHGCLELWPSKRPYQCAADVVGGGEDEIVVQKIYSPPAESTIKKESHYHNQNRHANHNQRRHNTIAFRCCLQDMCNFVDVDRTNAENRLHTLELNILPLNVNSGDRSEAVSVAKTPTSATNDVRNAWLTAALIIVPVLGALVLVLLILFACFLLKYDVKNQRQKNYYDAIGDDFDVDDDDDLKIVKLSKINVVSNNVVDELSTSSSVSNLPVIPKNCQSLPFVDSKRNKSEHILFIDLAKKTPLLRTAKSDSVLI